MPKLWNETIDAHRRAVHDAVLDTTATLVAERGLRGVTMSEVAAASGIGRATLYKYFPDLDAILLAWHEREVARHLDQLAQIRDRAGGAAERLDAVLHAYARIVHDSRARHDSAASAFLHQEDRIAHAQHRLRELIRELLVEGAGTGAVRDDVVPDELASYCLHALGAARAARSEAAVRRLVAVTMTALRPPSRRS